MGESDIWAIVVTGLVAFSSGMLLYGVILDRRDPFSYRRLVKELATYAHDLSRAELRLIQVEAVNEELEHGTTLLS